MPVTRKPAVRFLGTKAQDPAMMGLWIKAGESEGA